MKHFIKHIIVTAIILLTTFNTFAEETSENVIQPPVLNAESVVLMDQTSGKILYEKNAHRRMFPASTTKILTALLAIENCQLDDVVTIGNEIKFVEMDGSTAGLVEGECISLKDLIYGLMLPSGNDAAYSIAVYVARKIANNDNMNIDESIKLFVDKMNEKAISLGATDTNFTNPDGYHDANHYTSAYDLSLIAREAMKNDFFRQVVSTESYKVDTIAIKNDKSGAKTIHHEWTNKDELIHKNSKYYYAPATGIKTGYTSRAGYCLVSAASIDGMDVVATVLKSNEQGRWKDSINIFNYCSDNFQRYIFFSKDQPVGTVKVARFKNGKRVDLDIVTKTDYAEILPKSRICDIKKEILWDNKVLFSLKPNMNEVLLKGPISAGKHLGKVVYTLDGVTLAEADIYASRDAMKIGFTDIFYIFVHLSFIYWLSVAIMIFSTLLVIVKKLSKKKRKIKNVNHIKPK